MHTVGDTNVDTTNGMSQGETLMNTSDGQHHEDRADVTDPVYRLGIYLDEGRFDELQHLVTEDARVRTPGGRAEAALLWSPRPSATIPQTSGSSTSSPTYWST